MIRHIALFGFMLCVMAADQLSKWWVIEVFFRPRTFAADGPSQDFWTWLTTTGQELFPPIRVPVTDFFNLVMVWNKGVSFGMMTSGHAWMPYVFSGLAVLMAIGLIIWMVRAPFLSIKIPLAMVAAGAISNVWDRIRFGAVADFLDFYIADWHYWAFNIADSAIVVGVALLAFDHIILEQRRQKSKESSSS